MSTKSPFLDGRTFPVSEPLVAPIFYDSVALAFTNMLPPSAEKSIKIRAECLAEKGHFGGDVPERISVEIHEMKDAYDPARLLRKIEDATILIKAEFKSKPPYTYAMHFRREWRQADICDGEVDPKEA